MKAVIFDLDGVLIDSQPLHFTADIQVLKSLGIDCGQEDVQKYAGTANKERWPKYINDFSLDMAPGQANSSADQDSNRDNKAVKPEDLIATHVGIMNELLETAVIEPIPYVRELLMYLAEKGIKMAVASSSSLDYIEKVLTKAELIGYFDSIASGEEVADGKPAPDVFLLAAERLNAGVGECVIIEDSFTGVTAAKAAGIKCVGYINKNSGVQDLSKADIIISSFRAPEEWILLT